MSDPYEPQSEVGRKVQVLNELAKVSGPLAEMKRADRTQAFLEGDLLEALLAVVSANVSLRDACKIADITYGTVQKQLTEGVELRPKYEAARSRQAEAIMDEIAELEDKVEFESLDPKAAQVLIGSKQWRAERMNPKRYGPRSFQHIETIDQTALHLEAVRQLAKERREALQDARGGAIPVQALGQDGPIEAELLPASEAPQ